MTIGYFFSDDNGGYSDHDASEAGDRDQRDGSLLEGAQVWMHEMNGHENEHMSTQLIGAESIGAMMSTESPIEIAQHSHRMDLKLNKNDCNPPSNEGAVDIFIAGHSVTSCLPQAMAPPGFIVVDTCPPLDTSRQQRSLVGRMILYS